MFIASQTSRWVYGCPVNWETPLRIYIITSWCKLLTLSLFLSHPFLFSTTEMLKKKRHTLLIFTIKAKSQMIAKSIVVH